MLLAGCQFQGIWPQTYDGVPINKNSEANARLHETGELTSYNQEMRYPYMESKDILLTPDVDNSITEAEMEDMEVITFEAGEYVVGEDIEPGQYIAYKEMETGTEAAALIVTDRDDVRMLEFSVGWNSHLNLLEGYTLEVVSSRDSVSFRPVISDGDSMMRGESGHIMQGHHIIGDTLPSGTYSLLSLELMLMRADGTPQVFINSHSEFAGIQGMFKQQMMEMEMQGFIVHDDTDEVEEEEIKPILVELHDGDVVINESELYMELVE